MTGRQPEVTEHRRDGRMVSETVPTPAVIVVQAPPGSPPNQVTIRTSSSGKVEVVTPVAWQ